ncbi:MAG: nucleotidyltransferase family protein [Gammaproteobacteria bacterium]|nr:nucleotidyltransferase family protein [Gammaproteobacteria bacterium]
MKAMILAAGRGERMRPLTDNTPKPLLKVAGHSLIEHHIFKLKSAGFTELVINTAWLAEKIHRQIGDGGNYGVSIQYSDEQTALETGGGINKALPLLGNNTFLVVNGDVWCDYDYARLPSLKPDCLAHLILVNNPPHNPDGDFSINQGMLSNAAAARLTFSGIGLYRPQLIKSDADKFPLAPVLRQAADDKKISAEYFPGLWIDIGTTDRLEQVNTLLQP